MNKKTEIKKCRHFRVAHEQCDSKQCVGERF